MWRTRRNPTQVGRKTYLPLKANTVSVLVDYLNRKSNPWRACAYISEVLVFHDIHPSLPPHFQAALLVREGGGALKIFWLSFVERSISRSRLERWPKIWMVCRARNSSQEKMVSLLSRLRFSHSLIIEKEKVICTHRIQPKRQHSLEPNFVYSPTSIQTWSL